ncbi:predicted protein [Chaetomium globosum CBS 148.51]|uniref:Secreted protein n=1 Tax=Chaetomium globosum (strain ATCC 6205 / CBS 148.51 / DSM 1962 / NBRC 6347 / NRRL 1970) TaxID=306901 RepID=Q2GVE1_CHAGB|nr:uncharacterized protein CHGG_08063 [Chaetomium globosum CBS 148.51]EAQ86810.1 predicted protein [Chaetomium globosum CBS 148.51]
MLLCCCAAMLLCCCAAVLLACAVGRQITALVPPQANTLQTAPRAMSRVDFAGSPAATTCHLRRMARRWGRADDV